MKINIRDVEAVRAIRPVEAALYLRAKGWIKQEGAAENSSLWIYGQGAADQFEALLPMDGELRDYALRMGELLVVLAAAEKRSQLEVYADLLTVSSDVIRIRIADPDLSDGSLPIEEHAVIAQKIRDMVLTAACAATEQRAVWHKRKPAQAMNYMRRVRIGQSERGSYVVTVISRVPPLLHSQNGQFLYETGIPFERQVTQTLAGSLHALDRATADAAMTQKMEAFDQAVGQGLSANLCDAVAGLWGDNEAQRSLEFTFSWSPTRPAASDAVRRIVLSPDRVPVIREAARQMREREPLIDFDLSGPVVKLERDEGAPAGKVTVIGIVEERQARVVVELTDPSYHEAVAAHDSGRIIRTNGILVKEGRGFVLKNPGSFMIIKEP